MHLVVRERNRLNTFAPPTPTLPQFFKEANETYTKLHKEHESIRSTFTCTKTTPLESLVDLLKNLEVRKSCADVFLCITCCAQAV